MSDAGEVKKRKPSSKEEEEEETEKTEPNEGRASKAERERDSTVQERPPAESVTSMEDGEGEDEEEYEDFEEEEESDHESEGEEETLPGQEEGSGAPVIAPLILKKIRPEYSEKFRPGEVVAIIQEALREVIAGKTYVASEVQAWIREMTTSINEKVKALEFHRYKLITHVTIGELRGQGILAATKCMWDQDSDYSASYSFRNNSLFCTVTVYGVYYY